MENDQKPQTRPRAKKIPADAEAAKENAQPVTKTRADGGSGGNAPPVSREKPVPEKIEPVHEDTHKDTYDEENDIKQNKIMAALSYLLFFLPLVTEPAKTSKFARFHANQSLVCWIFYVGIIIITRIIDAIIFNVAYLSLWQIWWLFSLIWWLVYLAFAAFVALNARKAYQGKWSKVPLIGKITIIK